MLRAPFASAVIAVVVLLAAVLDASDALAATSAARCRVLPTPPALGATLLRLHRAYESHQPDVHAGHFSGPVGTVHVGICGEVRYASAVFDARYNGHYFGATDQPERFSERPGQGWRDLGNTGGDPCGSMPTALLVAWRLVRACPP